MVKHRAYTVADLNVIRDRRAAGVPARIIAAELGRTETAILNQCELHGFKSAAPPGRKPIARVPGIVRSTTWPAADIARLHDLWGHETARSIGRVMGRTKSSVLGMARREGLPPRQFGTPRPTLRARVARSIPLNTGYQRGGDGDTRKATHDDAVRDQPADVPAPVRVPSERDGASSNPPANELMLPLDAPFVTRSPVPAGSASSRACQFPLWAHNVSRPPVPALFCGAAVERGSWCELHRRVVFTPHTDHRSGVGL